MTIREFQEQIKKLYVARDTERGLSGTFQWFAEEVGELARALRKNEPKNLDEEFSDCLAWLVSLANLKGIDMERLAQRYHPACPKCKACPCACPSGHQK